MLKEIFLQRLNLQSKTVNNAIITLGDIDDSGKGKRFKSRFIQPGLAGYPGQFGTVLVKKETLDNSLNTIIGAPVIINHTDVTEENADDLRVGVISNAYYNEKDGWYWCEGVIWDETAQSLITDKNWSVSCSYDFLEENDEGGSENNVPYDREFTKLNFVHLALVDNPRYERANIVFNSKTVENDKWCTKYDKDGNPYQFKIDDGVVDLTDYFKKSPTINDVKDFLNKMVEQGREFATSSPDWLVDIPNSSRKKDHIAKSSQFQQMNKAQKRRHNKYIIALEDLLRNAEYLNEKPNTKPLKKPNTEKYHYFKTDVKIGEKPYKILFDTEEYKGDSTIKPQTVHLYDVREIKNSPSSANVLASVKNLKEECNTIITDIQGNFNPTGENMLNNVVNENWKTLYDKNGEPYHVDLDGTDEKNEKKKEEKQYPNRHAEILYKDLPELREKLHKARYERAKKREAGADVTFYDKKIKEYEDKEQELKDEMASIRDGRRQKQDRYISLIEENKTHNAKEQEMALLEELKKLINNVENGKGDEMQDKEKEKEVDNEKVDKRDIIRQIMAIAGKHEDNEDVRTIAKLAEKLAYDKSEAGSSDNKKEVKNEDEDAKEKKAEEEEKKEVKKDDVDNKKKSCDNSVENSKVDYFAKLNEIYNASTEPPKQNEYVSRADRLKAAEEYFG